MLIYCSGYWLRVVWNCDHIGFYYRSVVECNRSAVVNRMPCLKWFLVIRFVQRKALHSFIIGIHYIQVFTFYKNALGITKLICFITKSISACNNFACCSAWFPFCNLKGLVITNIHVPFLVNKGM